MDFFLAKDINWRFWIKKNQSEISATQLAKTFNVPYFYWHRLMGRIGDLRHIGSNCFDLVLNPGFNRRTDFPFLVCLVFGWGAHGIPVQWFSR